MKIRKYFKKMYKEEFDDPNEAFQDFLLSLISEKTLLAIIKKGKKFFYNTSMKK